MPDKADLFWAAEDAEQSYSDPSDIIDQYPEGEIVQVQRAVMLTDIFIVRVGDDVRQFDAEAEAEAWVKSKGMPAT